MTEAGSGRHAETLPEKPPSDLQGNFHRLAMCGWPGRHSRP
jgi:hypothetical protein